MSIRNQGAAVKAVRRRNSCLNRRGWISALIPSGVCFPLLAVGGGDLDRVADQRLGHLDRLLLAPVLGEPARALGDAAAEDDDDQRRDRAEAEHPAPGVEVGGDQQHDHADHGAEQDPDRLQAEGADQPAAAAAGRQHLGQVAGGDRVVEPDRDPEHEAEGDQRPDAPGEDAGDREGDEEQQVEAEDAAAADLVAERPEQAGAEDRADDRRRRDQALFGVAEGEFFGQQRAGDADDEEVEAVEQDPQRGQQPEAEVEPAEAGLVERGAERGRRGVGAHRAPNATAGGGG